MSAIVPSWLASITSQQRAQHRGRGRVGALVGIELDAELRRDSAEHAARRAHRLVDQRLVGRR